MLGGLVIVAACLAPNEPTAGLVPGVGLWVMHIQGGRFGDGIQVWDIWESSDSTSSLQLGTIPTRRWDGSPGLQLEPRSAAGTMTGGEYSWTVDLGGGDTLFVRYRITADTARGAVVERRPEGGSERFGLVGVRISPIILTPPPPTTQLALADSTPVVVLRMDDLPPTDRGFVHRLIGRGLWAELAIPTAFVGREGRPTWDEVHAWAVAGFTVAAHSRLHTSLTASDADFMGEVLGSLGDLAIQHLPTAVFVQPGSWKDSMNFQTPAMFHTWRGALFRTFVEVVEAYTYPVPQVMPLADSMRLGIGHATISDGASVAYVLGLWRAALRPGRFTVFLVHTAQLPSPAALDWFLDSLAVAQRAGRIRLIHSSVEAFGL